MRSVSGGGWGDRPLSRVTRAGTAPCRGRPHFPVRTIRSQLPESEGILVGLSLCRGQRGRQVTPSSLESARGAAWTHLVQSQQSQWPSHPQGPGHERRRQAGAEAASCSRPELDGGTWAVCGMPRLGVHVRSSRVPSREATPQPRRAPAAGTYPPGQDPVTLEPPGPPQEGPLWGTPALLSLPPQPVGAAPPSLEDLPPLRALQR